MGLIIIVLILIIAAYLIYGNFMASAANSPFTCLLSGFWRAPSSYLVESDTELISLYIESNLADGYIIIKKAEGYILNDYVEIKLKEVPMQSDRRVVRYECYFGGLDSEDFPCQQTMIFYPECNKIILFKNDRIYGVFYKDCESTETAMENHFAIKAEPKKGQEQEKIIEEDNEEMGESLGDDIESLEY